MDLRRRLVEQVTAKSSRSNYVQETLRRSPHPLEDASPGIFDRTHESQEDGNGEYRMGVIAALWHLRFAIVEHTPISVHIVGYRGW